MPLRAPLPGKEMWRRHHSPVVAVSVCVRNDVKGRTMKKFSLQDYKK